MSTLGTVRLDEANILLVGSDGAGLGGWLELGWLLDADTYPRASHREHILRGVVRAEASKDMLILASKIGRFHLQATCDTRVTLDNLILMVSSTNAKQNKNMYGIECTVDTKRKRKLPAELYYAVRHRQPIWSIPAVPKGFATFSTTLNQGTTGTPHLHLGRPLRERPASGTLSQETGYRVSLGAVLVGVAPRAHMVHVQTDQCLCRVSPAGVTVLALEEQQAERQVSAEERCVVGTMKEVWLGEEGTWTTAEFWLACYIVARLVLLVEGGMALHYPGAWVGDHTRTRGESERKFIAESDTPHCSKDFFPPLLALILVNAVAQVQHVRTGTQSATHQSGTGNAYVSSTRPTQNSPTSAVTPPANTAAPKAEFGALNV